MLSTNSTLSVAELHEVLYELEETLEYASVSLQLAKSSALDNKKNLEEKVWKTKTCVWDVHEDVIKVSYLCKLLYNTNW